MAKGRKRQFARVRAARSGKRRGAENTVVDTFAIVLSHGLLLFAFWRLMWRADLDDEGSNDRAAPVDLDDA
jgi:hypothetical protein